MGKLPSWCLHRLQHGHTAVHPTYSYTTMTTVSGPDVVIVTKNLLLVTAPTANGYQGGDNDVVPGAKLKYQVVLKNQGTTANAVALEQAISVRKHRLSQRQHGNCGIGWTHSTRRILQRFFQYRQWVNH